MKKLLLLTAAFSPILLLPLLLLMVIIGGSVTEGQDDSSSSGPAVPVACSGAGAAPGLNPEQAANARTIITVGQAKKVPAYGLVIAVATAMQESTLLNLPGGDADSIGLFQQRPSAGWGTPAQLHDPVYAAAAFYGDPAGQPPAAPPNTGLLQIPGWQQLPLTAAAQAVQRSAFPTAYADDEAPARAVVTALTGATGGCQAGPATLPDADVTRMVTLAVAQVGKTYVFGDEGPDTFDCSGLVIWSWQQTGYAIRGGRVTAAILHRMATPIPGGQEKTGDLLFTAFGSRGLAADAAGHVAIVVRPGLLMEAYTTGVPLRTRPYDPNDTSWRIGRLPASAFTKL